MIQIVILSIALILNVIFFSGGLHKIDEGYVGVYYKLGVLSPVITKPGYNVLTPFITKHESVQISVQTDSVRDITYNYYSLLFIIIHYYSLLFIIIHYYSLLFIINIEFIDVEQVEGF